MNMLNSIEMLARDNRASISDEEFFKSRAFRKKLANIAQVILKGKDVATKVIYDEKNENIGWTEINKITVNPGSEVFRKLKTRIIKVLAVIGVFVHELGHVQYTDFMTYYIHKEHLRNGTFYPQIPDTENAILMANAIQKNKDVAAMVFAVGKDLDNIFEDAYVETQIRSRARGLNIRALNLLNAVLFGQSEPYEDQRKKAIQISLLDFKKQNGKVPSKKERLFIEISMTISCIRDSFICYAGIGDAFAADVTNHVEREIIKEGCMLIDMARYEVNPDQRKSIVNTCLASLWPLLSQIVPDGINEGCGDPLAVDAFKRYYRNTSTIPDYKLSDEMSPLTPAQTPVQSDVEKNNRDANLFLQQLVKQQDEDIKVPSIENDVDGTSILSTKDPCGMNALTREIAKELAEKQVIEIQASTLREQAGTIEAGLVHQGIKCKVVRNAEITDEMVDDYNAIQESIVAASKVMQRKLDLKIKREPVLLTGLYSGKRIKSSSLCRIDGRIMSRKLIPAETPKTTIALALDISRSTQTGHKIEYFKQTALVIEDFCRYADIPCLVYGHTAYSKAPICEIHSFVEFERAGNNDKYRIMGALPQGCNRDGLAIRYGIERLRERSEEIKLLFIVSDGAPNHQVREKHYGSNIAVVDIANQMDVAKKNKIVVFVAAVGEDQRKIEKFYRESNFLNISDVEKLPMQLLNLIGHHIFC